MRLCVYCGSSPGANPRHMQAARLLGEAMARQNVGLVYGGGDLGLMGEIARAVLASGGHVTGIIPHFLERRERMLDAAQDMIVVPDMHTRKRLMFEKADAFVALPGGVGTLEELVEQLTWVQLGRHTKPVVIADLDGFWGPLLALLDHMRAERFIRPSTDFPYHVVTEVEDILPTIDAALEAIPVTKETIEPGL
jgi:uncharacterized protein (TIGR00730 family)